MGKSESAERSFNRIGAWKAHNLSRRQEENRGGTAGTLGKNQGSKEPVVALLRNFARCRLKPDSCGKAPLVRSFAVTENTWERPKRLPLCPAPGAAHLWFLTTLPASTELLLKGVAAKADGVNSLSVSGQISSKRTRGP